MTILRFTLAGDSELGGHAENVYTYDSDDEVDEGNASDVMDAFLYFAINLLLDELLAYIANTFVFNELRLEKCVDVVTNTWVNIGSQGITIPGEQASGNQLPEFIAIRCQANTDGPGRKGSKFISFLDELQWDTNTWTTALITAMLDYADSYAEPFLGLGTSISFQPGVFRAVDGIFDPFSGSYSVDLTASHQDRRETGIGI